MRTFIAALLLLIATPAWAVTTITNFDGSGNQLTRFDINGDGIDAHDGILFDNTSRDGLYYFIGTSYACGFIWRSNSGTFCGFKGYSSQDLKNWTPRGQLYDATTGTWQARCVGVSVGCFRPHVVYNAANNNYVLWINAQGDTSGAPSSYRVFTGPTPV